MKSRIKTVLTRLTRVCRDYPECISALHSTLANNL